MDKKLSDILREAGVVGAGGAGFPTGTKVDATAEFVIINGAECEPLLRVDQQLMAKNTKELLSGLSLVVKTTGAKKGIIALKHKFHDAVDAINKELKEFPNIEICELGNFYPAGDEQVIVYEATGRIVPEGGIPLNVGVVVLNVETAINVHHAYYNEKPVTHKYVSITGEVKNRITVLVPVGIKYNELIEMAGGVTTNDFVVINGGPMMGKIIPNLEDPITKTTKGIIVLPKNHSLVRSLEKDMAKMLKDARIACMQCSLCTEVCPRNLLGHNMNPHKMMRLAAYSSTCDNSTNATGAFLCCECRLCEYACVMDLQPWKLNGLLKKQMGASGIKNPHHNVPTEVARGREMRRFPISRLMSRLGLTRYDVPAPLTDSEHKFKRVTILLGQHIGAPAKAIVAVGDRVEVGTVVGEAQEGKLGAYVHSSIVGTVKEVTDKSVVIWA